MPESDLDIEVGLDRIAWNLPPAPDRPQLPPPVEPSSLEKRGNARDEHEALVNAETGQ
jgi:hypothetical protein